MPTQSSLGAGVLQTAMRLSISLGLAITAAVYGNAVRTPKGISDVNFPYERANLCSIIFAAIGILFIPFMRIGRQGSKAESNDVGEMIEEERPRTGGEYSDRSSRDAGDQHLHSYSEHELGLEFGSSIVTVDTCATTGSQDSFFPRWSWESDRDWKDRRYREPNVLYEVCIKCLAERRVVLRESGAYGAGWQQLAEERRHDIEEQRDVHRQSRAYGGGWPQLPDDRSHNGDWEQPASELRRERKRGDVSKGGVGWL